MFKTILVVSLLLVVAASAQQQKKASNGGASVDRGLLKHQWNSNFVNGPWSRIGKRARLDENSFESPPPTTTSGSSSSSNTDLCSTLTSQDLDFLGWLDLNEYYEQCVRGKSWFLDLLSIDTFANTLTRAPRDIRSNQDKSSSSPSRLVDLISSSLNSQDRD